MAIKNASDLLVYAKTASAKQQITRIYVKDNNPITFADGTSQGVLKINNVTNTIGQVFDDVFSATITQNTASDVLTQVAGRLTVTYGYIYHNTTIESITINGVDYKYREVRNYSVGIVPTLEIVNGTANLNDDSIIIEITQPGSSSILDPIAFSTSASISFNQDLRDCTNKDSEGFAEYKGGLRSFEISTETLQSVNPDVPLDGTDFFKHLKERSTVNLSFSDRVRNIIRTNLTQSGVDGFLIGTGSISQTNLHDDPFGSSTASKIEMTGSSTFKRLQYNLQIGRIEGKFVTWTFYVKGDPNSPNNNKASFFVNKSVDVTPYSFEILSGDGEIGTISAGVKKITQLNTGNNNVSANWTRVRVTYKFDGGGGGTTIPGNVLFGLCPGLGDSQSANDIIYTSSWQIELSNKATNYQDPTLITRWQGDALVSNINYESGVEENLTCSASFTGTGPVFYNGLGPELIEDTEFNDPNYWTLNNTGTGAASVVENGYGKIITTSGLTTIQKNLGLYSTPGDMFLLTYTVHTSTQGGLAIHDGWEASPDFDLRIPSSVGTHTALLKPGQNSLIIKRSGGPTTIWLSSISLKKVL